MKVKKRKILILYKYLLLLIIYIALLNILNFSYSKMIFLTSWLSNISFINIIYDIYKKDHNYMDLGIIFLSLIFLFCNGQFFLYSFGVSTTKLSIFKYSLSDLYTASSYFLYSFNLISLPFIIKSSGCECVSKNSNELDNSIKKFSFLCLIVFSFPFLYYKLSQMMISIRYGYESIYYSNINAHSFGDIIGYFSNLFVISLILLLYVYRNNKTGRRIFAFLLFLLIVMSFVTGLRGSAITLLICFALVYFKFINNNIKKQTLTVIVMIVILLTIIPIVKDYRSISDKSISSAFNYAQEKSQDSIIIETISELGGSTQPFIMVSNIIPSIHSYKYGLSYLSSFMAIIPSTVYSTSFFTDNAALDLWLMKAYHMNYGPGFSIMAESYYNFGFVGGVIFSFFLGYFFSFILYYKSKEEKYYNLNYLLSISFLLMSLMIARGSFFHVPKCIIYLMMLPFFAINIISKKSKKI